MSLETLFKVFNDHLASLRHCEQSETESVIVGTGSGFLADRYINGTIGIGAYFHSSLVADNSKGGDFLFVFENRAGFDFDITHLKSRFNVKQWLRIGGPRTDDMQSAVPVFSCPIVHHAKTAGGLKYKFVQRNFVSNVWLYRLDKVPTLLREWCNLRSIAVGLEFSSLSTDREFKCVLIGGRIASAVNPRSLIDTSIEGGPQMIEQFSQMETDFVRNLGVIDWTNPDAPCPIVVHVDQTGIGVHVADFIPKLGNGFSVIIRPFNALPTIEESPWHTSA